MTQASPKTGTLYLVPTPIGNLEDITLRAISILKSVYVIGAEDTRTSAFLLAHYEIKTPTVSYHKFNEASRLNQLINYLQAGKDIAIITDAGTPGISDPAAKIIKAAIENNFLVSALPGATALIPALVSSGLECSRFFFVGFLPTKMTEKREFLERIAAYPETLIFYESGKRLWQFLATIREHFGNRNISIGRELSKHYETYYRNCIDYYLQNRELVNLKGEFTIVCQGAPVKETTDNAITDSIKKYLLKGETISYAVNMTSKELNVGKNRTYSLALQVKDGDDIV